MLRSSLPRFLAVGLVGLGIHTATFTAVFHSGADKSLAWLCGFLLATAATWLLNRTVTFRSTGRRRRVEVARYFVVTVVAQSISYLVFRIAFAVLTGVPPSIDVVIGAVVATAFSYTGQRFFTFAAVDRELKEV